jgi:Subtilase family
MQLQVACARTKIPVLAEVAVLWPVRNIGDSRKERQILGWTSFGYTPQLPNNWKVLLVSPLGNHWARLVKRAEAASGQPVLVEEFGPQANWWQGGQPTPSDRVAGEVRLVVADVPFPAVMADQLGQFSALRNGDLQDSFRDGIMPKDQLQFHGFAVSRVTRLTLDAGTAPGEASIAFQFADIGAQDGRGKYLRGDINAYRLLTMLEYLIENRCADVVNISGGFKWDKSNRHANALRDSLNRLAQKAFDSGILIIAATGNSSRDGILYPARLSSVVGVSGGGHCGIAPINTYFAHREQLARRRSPLAAKNFIDPYVANGPQANCIGPSIGIPIDYRPSGPRMPKDDPSVRFELEGTSFAAPIISSRLACVLRHDSVYLSSAGRARSERAVDRLKEVCDDLGF